jgi:hypothetical protein
MLFVEQSAMSIDQSQLLVLVEFVAGVGLRAAVIYFDTYLLAPYRHRVEWVDPSQHLLGDEPGVFHWESVKIAKHLDGQWW